MTINFIKIDDKDFRAFQLGLKTFARREYPKINGQALNKAAFETMRISRRTARRRFILRNKWTERSIQFDRVKGFDPRIQQSSAGSTQDYLRRQEFGDTIQKTGKHGVAIPTAVASGESQGVRPRKRLVRRQNWRSRIKIGNRKIKAKNRKQYIFLAVRMAAKASGRNKHVFLPMQRHPGIYRVTGKKQRAKIRLIWDLSRPSIHLQRRPWLGPAVERVARQMPGMYIEAARRVLR